MPTVVLGDGRRIPVDDSFSRLPPAEQQRFVNEYVAKNQAGLPEEPAPTVGSMAKAAGSGLVRGLSGVAGLPGDVLGLVDAGLRKAPTLLGYPEAKPPTPEQRGQLGRINSMLEPPTTQQVTSSVEQNLTGPLYEPKNTAEKYMSTAAEFLPAAFSGPGRAAATTLKQAGRQVVRARRAAGSCSGHCLRDGWADGRGHTIRRRSALCRGAGAVSAECDKTASCYAGGCRHGGDKAASLSDGRQSRCSLHARRL